MRLYLDAPDLDAVAAVLLGSGAGRANALALGYRNHLVERGLAPATINRRLAAVRSLVKLARVLGLVNWTLEVHGLPAEAYRDTRGPGIDGVARLLVAIRRQGGARAIRNEAIVRLLADLALRRGEVAALDVADYDASGALGVVGKGRRQARQLTVPASTQAAIEAWLEARGPHDGPLFVCLDPARRGRRLSGRAIHRLIRRAGERAELGVVRPHGLRHAAITAGLDGTGGDVRSVRRFSRHQSIQTLLLYDDAREDLAGRVAGLVAGQLDAHLAGQERHEGASSVHPPSPRLRADWPVHSGRTRVRPVVSKSRLAKRDQARCRYDLDGCSP